MWLETLLLGISLSMDALAVSLALGAAERKNFTAGKILLTALFFGLFQALMPTVGWYGGTLCGNVVQKYGRYIASVLLIFLGGKMVHESFSEEEEVQKFQFGRLILLSFATSIDALLIGVSFACLNRTNVLPEFAMIGVITFLITAAGGVTGKIFGELFGSKCEIAGGVVLIGIGIKVLFFG